MRSNILDRIDSFARRHLFLSSYLYLLAISAILQFFGNYKEMAQPSFLEKGSGGIETIILAAMYSIPIFWVIPIFFISLLLYLFLKKKSSHDAGLSFLQKFSLAFIPALAPILLSSILIIREVPQYYSSTMIYLYPLAILTSCLYSAVFSLFFGWLSKASRIGIIIQPFIVSLVMGIFYLFLASLSGIHHV